MQDSTKKVLPYGLWPSPVSAGLISQRTRLDDVQYATDGLSLVWTESRSGQTVLILQAEGAAQRELTDEQSPRGGVGYGGGAFSTASNADLMVFANRDGRLYRRGTGLESPKPITPTIAAPNGMIASPAISPDGQWVVYVYSDGSRDFLASVDIEGQDWPIQLVKGSDFYMQPAWHPAGNQLAWIEWNHPNMPWDGARLQLARIEGTPAKVVAVQTIAGDEQTPVEQPRFSPDGRWLSFIEESGEWADLILYDLHTHERKVLVHGDGFDISQPAWVQGIHSMVWSPDSQQIYYLRSTAGKFSLWSIDISSSQSTKIETTPYTALGQLTLSRNGDELAFIASGTNQPEVIARLSLLDGKHTIKAAAYSLPATYSPEFLPAAREISWMVEGTHVYGLYYPPTHPQYRGEGLPPAIVHIHGGPTSMAAMDFNATAAYFTSRGYAYVEINYRGSTGFGRSYRKAMHHRWGDVDTEDAAACARALGEQGLADPNRLVIMGGSAGGYTVLNTLIRHPGVYKAGVCLYGVTNLFAINMETHKFEAFYNDSMVGPLPEAADRYQAWSPVFHAGEIRDALYIFQGSEDKVVPPSQAEAIIGALRAKGVPHKYKLYPGEGHGFRRSETIVDYLKETERFLQEYVLFAP